MVSFTRLSRVALIMWCPHWMLTPSWSKEVRRVWASSATDWMSVGGNVDDQSVFKLAVPHAFAIDEREEVKFLTDFVDDGQAVLFIETVFVLW